MNDTVIAPEPDRASGPADLSADWLRTRFAGMTPGRAIFEARADETFRAAAVLVPVVDRADGLTVMLTQRTDHLHDHPGQISFPGGRVEADDDGPTATALRETEEEVGLHSRHVELLGQLADYHTGTGFRVTPIVGLVHPPFELAPDSFEVAEVFEVPLSFLLDPANHRREQMFYRGQERSYYVMPWQHYHIWGATAGMLVALSEFLRRAG